MASTLFQLAALLPLFAASVTQAATTGSHDHLHAHKLRSLSQRQAAPALASPVPSGWASQGCWVDQVGSRALASIQTYQSVMTEEYCVSYCSSNGYPYAGVEYGDECYCGRSLASFSTKVDDSDCDMACAGNSAELCGGRDRMNVFKNSSYTSKSGPFTNAGPANWGFLGCYLDSATNRTMSEYYPQYSDSMTVAVCTDVCQTGNYTYSGVEYGGECFCSNSLDQSNLASDGLSGCNVPCHANTTEYCGGSDRLSVYGFGKQSTITPKWASQGCFVDKTAARTLRYAVGVQGGYTNMSVEGCTAACAAQKYTIAGMEYGQECWCDSAYQNGGGPAPDGSTGCNMGCKGNVDETCGGPNRLNVYAFDGTLASPTSTAATTSTTPTSTPVVSGIPKDWSYSGCFVDGANGRIIGNEYDSDSTTVESCIAYCQGLNMTIAGIEYSTQCFCGNTMVNGGKIADQDADCAMPCGGNSNEICGGPNRMSIYASSNFTTYGAPQAVNSSLPGNWTYNGCLKDGIATKVLPYQIIMLTNATVPACLKQCGEFGYSAASLEYGHECYCGDDTDRVNAQVDYLDASQCNMACSGQPDTMCGGPGTMNYYTQPPIDVWTQASGSATGEYDFLIGGVVIPLITSVGINNKVTFVEKHGTGPPNSTGAYELDVTQVNNFTAAWRTMNGLKTDVFCSAGLTLPDKSGRQINIGGWSTESLYGVRFYTPDGAPGQPSHNDWEENVEEVALQVGRWYPSAVQLVNGSILVVGGEDGSNGVPVPNLEVIPKPPGGSVLHMDWLERTDPNNLYPFLVVLPSNKLAVFYWNEARILDERTFETVRTLPNMPGAVDNFQAGRSYPMEGTLMVLPQKAPYTAPLEVIMCGGSTPVVMHALDNCVTIQPENPNANWTIERMPSRRVLTSMVALPDGTYLILNGAQQGHAGFGLATNPNHEALLYDPSKPLHHRMTRLANTTIDRLYHSEAILLPDGRVLVSGSDPEDQIHTQEYRVEAFIPPYLMGISNSSRPAYTISANMSDWSYGKNYQVRLTGNTDIAKISLMGAVSSTHGNSMGQRTIFPAFSCSGSTCTITAPPSGGITGGPGWFMLFLLNSAGVPSISQWVRIGGDPAGLGNWPNYSDFTLPGV